MTQDKTADPTRSPDPDTGKGEASLLRQVLAKLKEQDARAERIEQGQALQLKELSELRVSIEAATRGFQGLQAIVVNALPSRLLRLTAEHIALLREKAPTARVRLISPFKSGLCNLREGYTMDVMDPNVRTHGSSMDLALVVGIETDVDTIVARLVDEQVRELARLEEANTAAAAAAKRRELEAQVAALRPGG